MKQEQLTSHMSRIAGLSSESGMVVRSVVKSQLVDIMTQLARKKVANTFIGQIKLTDQGLQFISFSPCLLEIINGEIPDDLLIDEIEVLE